jgi:class 3 adenylate cyclase
MDGDFQFEPLKGGSNHERASILENNPSARPPRFRRRSSIAAGPSLQVTPEYYPIERSTSYSQFAEATARVRVRTRRNSLFTMTKSESETKLRNSLASMMDYQGQSKTVQILKERFERRGSVMTRSSNDRASVRSSVIGSVVETGTPSHTEEDRSMDWTSVVGKESGSMPLTEIHQKNRRKRRSDLERQHLIESLVNFSCHTPRAVLEDLVTHELNSLEENENPWKDEDSAVDFADHASLSSLSSEEGAKGKDSENDMANSTSSIDAQLLITRPSLPRSRERESALLFVDINGFTKLSTMLDVESLSKVINSYFEMIVSEVIFHGGDILKFAGDAFFAEWSVREEDGRDNDLQDFSALKQLDATLSSSQDTLFLPDDNLVASCVCQAAKCAASIVKKFSDYHVPFPVDSTSNKDSPNEAMLNVHCGIGVGHMMALHVGDYREDDGDEGQEENAVELRREYLFLGDAINQVSVSIGFVAQYCCYI